MRPIARFVLMMAMVFSLLPLVAGATAQESPSAEQQLADRFSPIALLKEQPSLCSRDGEPYLPMPVDLVLNDPEVMLRREKAEGELRDPVVTAAPDAQDLANKDETYYLDLPGNPRLAQCTYEEWARTRMDELGLKPTIYARVATEATLPGMLVLQYWFYWAFNDFNNTHESDWEMIQLTFEADSAEEALDQDPAHVTFAQHGGGENADWDDPKVERDGDHIMVYPASGSHASYYGDAIWMGWGPGGTGFGCDDSSGPHVETPLEIVLVPNDPDPDGPFAWLLFGGRWGERQNWEFNGPLTPSAGTKWDTPQSWTDTARPSSLAISGHTAVGPGPAALFCAISSFAGSTAIGLPIAPELIVYQTMAILLGLVLLAAWNWRYIAQGAHIFFRHAAVFVPISLMLLPVAIAGSWIERQLRRSDTGDTIVSLFSDGDTSAILGTGFASFQQFLLLALVAPAIIHATNMVINEGRTGVRASWEQAIRRYPTNLGALLLNMVLLLLMSLTIVLLPFAVYRAVQWLYTSHAVMIDNAGVREARHVSRERMRRRWLRTLAMSALVWLVSGAPGPVVANLLLLTGLVSLGVATMVSSVIYAISFGITIAATTVYYLRLGDVPVEETARVTVPRETSAPMTAMPEPGTA
jgi:hypothetical protein